MNTLRTIGIIKNRLESEDCTSCFQTIAGNSIPSHERFDLHIFSFPEYSLDIPRVMLRYMQKLPKGNRAMAAVIVIKGKIIPVKRSCRIAGVKGGAVERARRVLTKKKYRVIITSAVSFHAYGKTGRVSTAPDDEFNTLRFAEAKINAIAESIVYYIHLKDLHE